MKEFDTKSYAKYLKARKEDIRKYLSDVVKISNGYKLTSKNIQYALDALKSIEAIEEFIEDDMPYFLKGVNEK